MILAGELSEREALILQAVVHTYVTTAEPVGSRTVVKRYGLDLSPATVRNVMADLEDAGYLQHIHTSSGRVPSDRGYRYYVDYLMRVQELTLAERARIERELSHRLDDADEVMRHTSQLLALVTHQAGLVEAPGDREAEVRRIEVMPVSCSRVAVVIVDNCGRVRTVMVALESSLDAEEAVSLSRFLNDNLRGSTFDELPTSLDALVKSAADEQRRLAERALAILTLVPAQRPSQLYLDGATQLFEQPEFHDVDRAREVFGLLEERECLAALLRASVQDGPPQGTSVMIGSEAGERGPGLREISLVASPYRVGARPVGVLGVLGPRRMEYSRLMAIVDYTANMLSRFLTKLAG